MTGSDARDMTVRYAHTMTSSRHDRAVALPRSPRLAVGAARSRSRSPAAHRSRGARARPVRRRRVPPAHAGAHLRLAPGAGRSTTSRRSAPSRCDAAEPDVRHRAARPGRDSRRRGARRARRRRQHHRHRARRERLPRAPTARAPAGRPHLAPQLQRRPDACPTSPIVGPAPTAQLDDRLCTAGARHGATCIVDVFGWFSTSAYADTVDSGARLDPDRPRRASSTPVTASPTSGRGAARSAGRRIDAADPRRRRRQPGRRRRRAERPERHRRGAQRRRHHRRPGGAAHVPVAVARRRCRPAQPPTTSQPQPVGRRDQGQPGDRAGRRRRQASGIFNNARQHRTWSSTSSATCSRRPTPALDARAASCRSPSPFRTFDTREPQFGGVAARRRARPRTGASPTSPARVKLGGRTGRRRSSR